MTTFAANKRYLDRPSRMVQSSADLLTIKTYGTTDSMAAWSHNKRERTGYALRKMSEPVHRKPPVYICRKMLRNALCTDDLAFEYNQSQEGCWSPQRPAKSLVIESLQNQIKNQQKEIDCLRLKKERRDIRKMIVKQYNVLNDNMATVREQSLRALDRGGCDGDAIGGYVCRHLTEVTEFFECNLSRPPCPSSRDLLKRKVVILEQLKKCLHHNSVKMDEWVSAIMANDD